LIDTVTRDVYFKEENKTNVLVEILKRTLRENKIKGRLFVCYIKE